MGWRLGVDTGGTFTDIVAVSASEIRTAKVASTPPEFEKGVLRAIEAVRVALADVEVLAHGTTVTTNALITKTGAPTGLLTTEGFRDVLELRRHNRGELYDILWDPPEPLVPRRRRLEARERIDYAGAVIRPLDEESVRSALERLRDLGIESLAVCLLHAYVEPAHELRIRELVRESWPELYVSISSDLLREPQEFERTATTVANAYVGPVLAGYVARLERRLADSGFGGRLLIVHSGGGLLPAPSMLTVPARTLVSGPAAGALAAEVFDVAGTDGVISLDIGGTSADIAVVRDGKALLVNEYEPEFGLPIRFPTVDLVTIGAGGGSIAWVDAAGTPRVGPQSAAANPGPACYGRGGEEPTVTDAHLVLGRLSPDTPLAGGLRLERGLADAAVGRFARRIGLKLEEAALGILQITNSNMARAIRVLTVERGLDPRRYALLPFGGAGPMHACELAESLGVRRVLCPVAPGVTSALGTLFADIVHDLSHSLIAPLRTIDSSRLEAAFRELELEGVRRLTEDRVPPERRRLERTLELRYLGQLKTIPIEAEAPFTELSIDRACRRFLDDYGRRYQYVTDEIEIELSVIRVRARGLHEAPALVGPERRTGPGPSASRQVRFVRGSVDTAVVRRETLREGVRLRGPVVVEQTDSTTVLPPGWALTARCDGTLLLEAEER